MREHREKGIKFEMLNTLFRAFEHLDTANQQAHHMSFVCLFGFEALRPSQQFFSHVGTEPPLPGYYQYLFRRQVYLAQ